MHGTKYDKYFEAPFHKNKFGGIKLTRLVKRRKKILLTFLIGIMLLIMF